MSEDKAGHPLTSQVARMTIEAIGLGALQPDEELWRDRYTFLKEHGYTLRPRYNPDWVPSWMDTDQPPYDFEDFVMTLEGKIIDAIQTASNQRVTIKIVSRSTNEIGIARLLSAKEQLTSPSNHCVPIFDVLPDPINSANALLVMLYLRPFNDPPFEVVLEVLDFIEQTLEGLCFIHNNNVAHRDCSTMNIMMDGRPLYPDNHHPINRELTMDLSGYARQLSRLQHPVKYYFIDFGLSSYFEEGESPYVLGTEGADREAPELSNVDPYNAFMLDVFILGHVYQVQFLQPHLDLAFLEPLVSAMTNEQPERRPTTEVALRMFQNIRRGLNNTQLFWRLRKRGESGTERVVYDAIAAAKIGFGLVRRGLMGN